jgi:hypothetical protein
MAKNKYIETPDLMWDYFLQYKKLVKSTPILIKDWVGKDADQVYKEKERPLTFIGFQNWLDDENIISDVTDYFENKQERYSDYIRICSRIRRNIQDDQICGGMVGIYNPSITQRLNGLSESVKQEHSGEIKGNAPQSIKVTIVEPLSDDE